RRSAALAACHPSRSLAGVEATWIQAPPPLHRLEKMQVLTKVSKGSIVQASGHPSQSLYSAQSTEMNVVSQRSGAAAGTNINGEVWSCQTSPSSYHTALRSETARGCLLLADQFHIARGAVGGPAALPADPAVLDMIVIGEGDSPFVHVLVLGRVQV